MLAAQGRQETHQDSLTLSAGPKSEGAAPAAVDGVEEGYGVRLPANLGDVLKEYVKAVAIAQPSDLYTWSAR
jgi:hypothetical protein